MRAAGLRLLVLAVLAGACGSDLPASERGEGWRTLSASPLSARGGHSAVWTGREMLVWGGAVIEAKAGADDRREPAGTSYDPKTGKTTPLVAEYFADGAAYDPESDSWRELSESPLTPRSGHAAVWTGDEMLVFGGWDLHTALADGAAYDPKARRWRRIAGSPFRRVPDFAAVWTGNELIVWGGMDHQPKLPPQGAAYDPERDRWRRIARFPLPARQWHSAVWTGEEMIAGAAPISSARPTLQTVPPTTRRPTPGAFWRPGRPQAVIATTIWTGREMIVWGGQVGPEDANDGAAYDPLKDRWRPLRQAPLAGRHWASLLWTGREMIAWGGYQFDEWANAGGDFADGAAYDPKRNRWRRLPGGPLGGRFGHGAVWTERELLVWGGEGDRYWADGAAYRPPS